MDQHVLLIRPNTKKIQAKIFVIKTESRAFPSLRKRYRYLGKSNY